MVKHILKNMTAGDSAIFDPAKTFKQVKRAVSNARSLYKKDYRLRQTTKGYEAYIPANAVKLFTNAKAGKKPTWQIAEMHDFIEFAGGNLQNIKLRAYTGGYRWNKKFSVAAGADGVIRAIRVA